MMSKSVKKVRFAFILSLAIVLGLFLAVPAEDVPETAFDESETPAYEGTPPFSIEVPQGTAPEAPDVQSAVNRRSGALSPFTSTRINGEDTTRSPNVRLALALLSILRC
jgi:hypothetical protein